MSKGGNWNVVPQGSYNTAPRIECKLHTLLYVKGLYRYEFISFEDTKLGGEKYGQLIPPSL